MPKIFISYRRDDSADAAGRLHDRLSSEFGKASVFIDIDNIPFGVDFRTHLSNAVGNCDILLAVMGDEWLDARDREGKRRLDDEADFVRIEIATALQRQIPVVPILIGANSVPKPDQLPGDLRDLAFRNAAEIRAGSHFSDQVDRLIRSIRDNEVKSKPAAAKPVLVAKRASVAEPKPSPVREAKVPRPREQSSAPKASPPTKRESIPLWQQAFLLYPSRTTVSFVFRVLFFVGFGLASLMTLSGIFMVDDPEHKFGLDIKIMASMCYFMFVYVMFWLPARVLDGLTAEKKEPAAR